MRTGRRGWRALVPGVAAIGVGILQSLGASAASSWGDWQGTLTLSIYPCPGGGTCAGSFSGFLSGTVAGIDATGHPFVVVWPDPSVPPSLTNLSASFTYSEACPLGATGGAAGTFSLTGGYVDDNGTVAHDGAMTGQFAWLRVGLAVAISTSGGVVTGGGQTLATQQTIGDGAGAFVPLGIPSTCVNVQSLTAQVTGAFGQAQ